MDKETDGNISLTRPHMGSFGPQCGDKYIAALDPHIGN